jgi:WD40 repeat protein
LAAEQQARAEVAARGRARARRFTAVLAVSLLVAVALAALAQVARQTAIDERNRAIPGQLAAQSQATLRDFPARGLLLAVEAQRAMLANDADVPAADAALTEALSFTGGTVLARQTSDVTASKVSHDSSKVAIGMKNGSVQVTSLGPMGRGRVAVLRGPRRDVADVFFSADDRWLIVTHRDLRTTDEDDRIVRLWDLRTSPPAARVLPGEGKRFGFVALSPDGRWILASTTTDRSVRLWDLRAAVPTARFRVPAGRGADAAFSPSGKWAVVIAGGQRRARIWDLTKGGWTALPGVRAALMGNAGSGAARAWRNLWVVTRGGGTTMLWDLTGDHPLRRPLRLARPLGEVRALTTSRDGRWLVGAEPYSLLVWRLSGPRAGTPRRVPSPGGYLESVAISRNSRWLVVTASTQLGYGGQGRILNLSAPLPVGGEFEGWLSYGTSTMSTAGGRFAHTDLETGIVRVSDLAATTGQQPPTVDVSALGREVRSFFVTSNDRWLVDAVDKTVAILDVRQLCEAECTISPIVLHAHEEQVTSAIVSPNLSWLVTHSADRTTRLWDFRAVRSGAQRPRLKVTKANRAALIARACETAGRNLTRAEWTTYFGDTDYRRSCPEQRAQ